MSGFRVCVTLLLFAALALALVALRGGQTRAAAYALRLESQSAGLRRDLWSVKTSVARLRTPQRVREGLEHFEPDLVSPKTIVIGPETRLASHRRTE